MTSHNVPREGKELMERLAHLQCSSWHWHPQPCSATNRFYTKWNLFYRDPDPGEVSLFFVVVFCCCCCFLLLFCLLFVCLFACLLVCYFVFVLFVCCCCFVFAWLLLLLVLLFVCLCCCCCCFSMLAPWAPIQINGTQNQQKRKLFCSRCSSTPEEGIISALNHSVLTILYRFTISLGLGGSVWIQRYANVSGWW